VSAVPAVSTGPATGAALLTVRRAAEGDRQELVRMLARCSADTRYRRFHGPVKAFPEPYLSEALAGSPVHVALVASVPAEAGDGAAGDAIVALASCRLVDEGVAELGLLVEDGWQRQGTGSRLLREIADFAAAIGLRAFKAQLLAEQAWITKLLRPYGQCQIAATGGLLTVTVRLPRPGELPARRAGRPADCAIGPLWRCVTAQAPCIYPAGV
jgi:GNAT superfamily N-acetyltransferase